MSVPEEPDIDDPIDLLASEGSVRLDAGDLDAAAKLFAEGLALSEEEGNRMSAGWFHVHLGEVYFAQEEWVHAAHHYAEGISISQNGNPYVHLKRGQSLYEIRDYHQAKVELYKALMLDGFDPLFSEDDHKYFDFAVKGVKLPDGCDSWESWKGAEPGSTMYGAICDPAIYRAFDTPSN